jgi:hypothetical protein
VASNKMAHVRKDTLTLTVKWWKNTFARATRLNANAERLRVRLGKSLGKTHVITPVSQSKRRYGRPADYAPFSTIQSARPRHHRADTFLHTLYAHPRRVLSIHKSGSLIGQVNDPGVINQLSACLP